jgi:uncharacterized membrane protein YfcA
VEVLGYLSAIVMGVTLGLIGGGGSILTVPILVYLFGQNPVLATGYSLFIVGLTSLVGGLSYVKKGLVDFKTGITFAVPSFMGVYLTRAYVVPSIPDPVFTLGSTSLGKGVLIMGVFAILMVLASISMIRGGNGKATTPIVPDDGRASAAEDSRITPQGKYALIGLEGIVVGGITGFVGAGGGFLIIPALVVLARLPMKVAVGTSLLIIAVKSLLGFIGDVQHNANVAWGFLGLISVIAVGGILLGSWASHYVPEARLKKGFGWFVLIMGGFILLEQIRHL